MVKVSLYYRRTGKSLGHQALFFWFPAHTKRATGDKDSSTYHIHVYAHTSPHTHACTHVMHTHACTHMHAHTSTHVNTSIHTHMHMHKYTHMHAHTSTHVNIHAHTCICTNTNKHTHMHACAHTSTHMHMHKAHNKCQTVCFYIYVFLLHRYNSNFLSSSVGGVVLTCHLGWVTMSSQ